MRAPLLGGVIVAFVAAFVAVAVNLSGTATALVAVVVSAAMALITVAAYLLRRELRETPRPAGARGESEMETELEMGLLSHTGDRGGKITARIHARTH